MSLSLSPSLSRSQVESLHERSVDLLARVGVDYKTFHAIQLLDQAGCPVDQDSTRVCLPRDLVEWALEQAPRVVRLCARDPAHDVILDGRRPHHTTDSQGTQAIDLETGTRHDATAEDLRRGLLFADALDQAEIVNVMVAASDVPAHLRTIRHFALAFGQTSKHVRSGVLHAAQVPFLVDMARAAAGGEWRPIFSAVNCTISPLMHDGPMTEACIELARLGVPIMIYPMPLAGGTAPVTLAGTVLLHNAEFLSGLVLCQLASPGTPVIYGTGASQLDMQSGRFGGGPDGHAMRLALCDLARYYHLPVNLWGLSTSSHHLDALYGYEATTHALLATLAGVDEIYSLGLLASAQVLSLEKMVLDNHLARQIGLAARPLAVDQEHLASDLIERVGIGGHFLGQRETRAATRREYQPPWPPAGRDLLELVHEEALEILHHHQPPPLPPGAAKEIEAFVAEADTALRGGRAPEGG
ncbi:MAG: trimethylamine methyltransferase family protein [Anaerolineae bacterium]